MSKPVICPACGRQAGKDVTYPHCSYAKVPQCNWLMCSCGETYDWTNGEHYSREGTPHGWTAKDGQE